MAPHLRLAVPRKEDKYFGGNIHGQSLPNLHMQSGQKRVLRHAGHSNRPVVLPHPLARYPGQSAHHVRAARCVHHSARSAHSRQASAAEEPAKQKQMKANSTKQCIQRKIYHK